MIIKHEFMEPYFIEVEKDGNHTVKQKRPATPKYPEGYSTPEGYFSSMPSALKKIIKLKSTAGEATVDLGVYLFRLETLINKISKIQL